jgi:nonribosomal peptide synthetase protein BlmX
MTLYTRFLDQAARTPDQVAVSCGDQAFSYSLLRRLSQEWAAELGRWGVTTETVVAICVPRSPSLLVAMLATMGAGAAWVPIDPDDPWPRIEQLLDASGAAVVLTAGSMGDVFAETSLPVLTIDEPAPTGPPPAIVDRSQPDALAYLLFTSGSTGKPKGVLVEHGQLMTYLSWAAATYGVSDAVVHSSVSFDMTITSLFLPLLGGAAVRLVPHGSGVAGLAAHLLAAGHDGILKLTPSQLTLLEQELGDDRPDVAPRVLVLGGEPPVPAAVAAWMRWFPRTRVFNEYGPTETVVGCCVAELAPGDLDGRPVPIGDAVPYVTARLLDDRLRPVAAGDIGELYIAGPVVARGYHGQAAATAAAMLPDPFATAAGARCYRTGDLARVCADGRLEYVGRRDEQVKITGVRVEPGEIEAVLAGCAGVAQCAVVAEADRSGRLLVAYVGANSAEAPSAGVLRAHLAARLPPALVPSRIVVRPSLPLTANGKVDRARLGSAAPPEPPAPPPSAGSSLEEVLLAIWSQVLGQADLTRDDNYFNAGGDSIRAVRIVAWARERGIPLSLGQLYAHPTVRLLSAHVRERSEQVAARPATAPFSLLCPEDRAAIQSLADVEDAFPLSQLQLGMVFHRMLDAGSAVYHDVFRYRLATRVDLEALGRAAEALVANHAALRTTFDLGSYSEPLQIVHRRGPSLLFVEDLRGLPPAEQSGALERSLEREIGRNPDPGQLPFVRITAQLLADDLCELLVSFHHAILDGWSDAVMLTELCHEYHRQVDGRGEALGPPRTSQRDHIALERAALASAEVAAHWDGVLRDGVRSRLVTGNGALGSRARRAATRVVEIPNEVSWGLRRTAATLAVPIKTVLLAAHAQALSAATGSAEVSTCMVASGRPESDDGERALGLFINTVPVRMSAGTGTWESLIDSAFELERQSLPHRWYPLAALVRRHGLLSDSLFYFTSYHIFRSLDRYEGFRLVDARSYEQTSFPLVANFNLDHRSGLVKLMLTAQPELVDEERLEAIAGHYLAALQAAAADYLAPLPAAAPAGAAASGTRESVLTSPDAPATTPVVDLVDDQVRTRGAAPAVSCAGAAVSYDELDAGAGLVAAALSAPPADDRQGVVALLLPPGPLLSGAALGALRAGAAFLPIDPAQPPERTRALLARARPSVVLASAETLALAEGWNAVGLDAAAWTSRPPAQHRSRGVSEQSLAYVNFTSGTTGEPKAVMITRAALANALAHFREAFAVTEADVFLGLTSPAFDVALLECLLPLTAGARIVAAPASGRADPGELDRLIRTAGVNVVQATPTTWRMMIEAGWRPPRRMKLICGGETLGTELAATLLERSRETGTELWNAYGPTETTIWSTLHPVAAADLPRVPLGAPIRGTDLYLLDASLRPVPVGAEGDVFLAGAGLARGYRAAAAATAARFLPDPLSPVAGARMYRTGDRARLTDGHRLEFLGRLDDQVKLRGHRVELGEVEAAILQHEGVVGCAVVPFPDERGETELWAFVQQRDAGAALVPALRRRLQGILPAAAVPRDFVVLESLPRTTSGKLDRRALARPSRQKAEVTEEIADPVERVVADVVGQMLGRSRLGAEDNLLHEGLDSLKFVRLRTTLAQLFGVECALRALFEAPSIRGVAAVLKASGGPDDIGRTAALLLQVAGLSDEEVRAAATDGRP